MVLHAVRCLKQCRLLRAGTLAAGSSQVRFTPNGEFLVVSTLNSRIRLWDYLGAKVLKTYAGHKNDSYCVFSTIWGGGGGFFELRFPTCVRIAYITTLKVLKYTIS